MKYVACICACLLTVCLSQAQPPKTEHLIIVTLDGMRWQEVFRGVDAAIMNKGKYTSNREGVRATYWDEQPAERRRKLMPFLWTTVAQQGTLIGNRDYGNYANLSNKYRFSYPGYNELFTGYPDEGVNSNNQVYNKNTNVLEFLNKQAGYEGKVVSFCSWGTFPYIFNEPRSKFYLNADQDSVPSGSPGLELVQQMQTLATRPLGVRADVFSYFAAREYLKLYRPKVLHIGLDETDEYGHQGRYDQYLAAAHAADAMIRDLWETLQHQPGYAGTTTLIVTTDHGRGDRKKRQWKEHGRKVKDADGVWMAVIGPDIKPGGELKAPGQVYLRQLATTIAAVLGFEFKPEHPVAAPIELMLK